MKKILTCLLITMCLMLVGCEKEKSIDLMTKWNNDTLIKDNDMIEMFNRAKRTYNEKKLTPIALLATQVVSGTNYMFLCEGTDFNNDTLWVIVIVYQDLQGNVSVTSVKELNLSKYYEKDNVIKKEKLVGGWQVYNDNLDIESTNTPNEISDILLNNNYDYITLLGQNDSNYLVLCKKVIEDESSTNYDIITIKDKKIVNTYELNLADFNK